MIAVTAASSDEVGEIAVETFKASDGMQLAYYIDDFTDPWKRAPILLLLHAAMGSARRYYAWFPL